MTNYYQDQANGSANKVNELIDTGKAGTTEYYMEAQNHNNLSHFAEMERIKNRTYSVKTKSSLSLIKMIVLMIFCGIAYGMFGYINNTYSAWMPDQKNPIFYESSYSDKNITDKSIKFSREVALTVAKATYSSLFNDDVNYNKLFENCNKNKKCVDLNYSTMSNLLPYAKNKETFWSDACNLNYNYKTTLKPIWDFRHSIKGDNFITEYMCEVGNMKEVRKAVNNHNSNIKIIAWIISGLIVCFGFFMVFKKQKKVENK